MTLPPPPPPRDGGGSSFSTPAYPPPPHPPSAYPGWYGGPPPYPAVAGPVATLTYRGAPETQVVAAREGRLTKLPRWGVPDFFITWGLWLVFSLLAAGVAVAVDGSAALESPSALMVLVMLTMPWIGMAGWPLLVSFWKGNGPVPDFGLTARGSDLLWGVGYGLVALVAAALVALATQALFGEFDSAVGDLVGGFQNNLLLLLIFGLLVGLGAPIVEELAFRGLLFGALAKSGLAPWLTIGVSGLLFSLMHFEPIRIPLLLSTGIVLGIARYHRRSTTVSIVAHMTNNIPAAVALVFLDSTGVLT